MESFRDQVWRAVLNYEKDRKSGYVVFIRIYSSLDGHGAVEMAAVGNYTVK